MGKKKLPRARFASVIRTAIADARSDAELWGTPVENGIDSPRLRESRVHSRVGGSWSYTQGEIYELAYGRAKSARLEALWRGRSRTELKEARAAVDRNWVLRTESREQHELRILRERVETVEAKFASTVGSKAVALA